MQNGMSTTNISMGNLLEHDSLRKPLRALVSSGVSIKPLLLAAMKLLRGRGGLAFNLSQLQHKAYIPRRVWKRHGALLLYRARIRD